MYSLIFLLSRALQALAEPEPCFSLRFGCIGKLYVLKDLEEMIKGTDQVLKTEPVPTNISYKSFKA